MLTIKEISSKKEIMQFIKFPWEVYKNDANWVPPLIFDTQNMLNKNKAEIAYNIIDIDGSVPKGIKDMISSIEGVIMVRILSPK